MKTTKLLLAFLAVCLIMTFLGCEDGGSSDSDSIGKLSGAKYVVTNSIPDPENLKVVSGKGIEFTVGGKKSHVYKTIVFDKTTLDTNGKFTSTCDYALPYGNGKKSDSGKWSRSGSTITLTSSSGTFSAIISSDGKTLEDTGAEPILSARLIYTKQ